MIGHAHRPLHSIKGRLVLLFVVLAIGTAGVFGLAMQRLLHSGWEDYAQPLMADYADRLAAEIGSPPDPGKAYALTQVLPITVRIDGPRVHWDSQPARGPRAGVDVGAHRGPFVVRRTADGHRIVFGLARAPDEERPRLIGWTTLAVLLLLTGLAYAAVRHLLAPLQAIAAGVEAYGRGEFEQPIAVRRRDELGLLTERINGMARNLSGMLQAQRTLLLAISHELRSPLTRARLNAELVAEGPERDALLRDLAEMRDLITALLESERLARGTKALQTERVDLGALVREVAATFAGQPLTLQLEAAGAPVQADPTRLRLLLRNLVDNALRHGSAPVEVYARREADGRIALGVRDHGPGVAADQIELLGQPFHRPDSARTRGSGGVGLGLTLCRLVAQAHGGELRIRLADPGLDVSAVWPASSAAAAAHS